MGEINLSEGDTHGTPSAGYNKLYPKTDKKWYYKDSTGAETEIGAGSTGAVDSVQYNASYSAPSHAEGLTYYDQTNKCLVVLNDESSVVQQIGQELFIRVYNDTGVDIADGKICYLSGVHTDGFPKIALARADIATTCISTLGFSTHLISNGDHGYITIVGVVRGLNTSGCSAGQLLYLSDSTAGGYVDTAPDSPNYLVTVGNCVKSDASAGTIFSRIGVGNNTKDVINVFNGTALQSIAVTIETTPTTVSCQIEASGTGDIDLFFNGGFVTFDATPAAAVVLTPGTDVTPVQNWVYILESTGLLTANTTGWPATQHAPVATVVCQSAASANSDGVYKMHAWTDHIASSNEMGHITHVNKWIRGQHATWLSGVVATYNPTVGGGTATTVHLSTTSGQALQLHEHTFPALNTATGSPIYVVNDSSTAYNKISGFVRASLTADSAGVTLANKYWNGVIWGVVSEETEDCHYFLNLPSNSYSSSADAFADALKYNDFSIPGAYKGCGFLISLVTFKDKNADGTLEVLKIVDLRGSTPISAGGGVSTAQTDFDDASFRVHDATDPTKEIAFEAGGITTATTRTFTAPDKNGTLATTDDVATKQDSLPLTTEGDILYRDGSGYQRLPKGSDGDILTATASTVNWEAPAGGGTFVSLTDTPANYSGSGGKVVAVNSGATALEFVTGGGGTFLSLTDTPSAYTSAATKSAVVNVAGTAIEFVARQPQLDANLTVTVDLSGVGGDYTSLQTAFDAVAPYNPGPYTITIDITNIPSITDGSDFELSILGGNYAHITIDMGEDTGNADGTDTIIYPSTGVTDLPTRVFNYDATIAPKVIGRVNFQNQIEAFMYAASGSTGFFKNSAALYGSQGTNFTSSAAIHANALSLIDCSGSNLSGSYWGAKANNSSEVYAANIIAECGRGNLATNLSKISSINADFVNGTDGATPLVPTLSKQSGYTDNSNTSGSQTLAKNQTNTSGSEYSKTINVIDGNGIIYV